MSGAGAPRALVEREGAIALLSVNRPEARNALDAETLDALHDAIVALEHDGAVRCVILTGAGDKAFAAGADIKAMAAADPAGAELLVDHAHRLGDLLEASRLPVIAAVHGFALGGGFELALACDFIYAARGANVGFPEVGLGVIPGMGGTQRLVQRIGVARARELIYTGRLLDAEAAARMGVVNEVVERAELLPRVRAVAAEIAARAPLAVAAAKRAIRRGADQPLDAGIALERQIFASLFASHDQKEGMRAFLEKRAPVWTGR
ncbi:MAG TPA: enoyl-CoA hydratase-related protein [Polyangia bacterium]|nr:enoyl-CoA hydratase-related protein [Polyangia bacterium]